MEQTASPSPSSKPQGRAEARYNELTQDRSPFLDRARSCSALTIPTLIPQEDLSNGDLPSLWQSVGANGVTNLASKLLLTMLPPNEPCFRLRVNNLMVEKQEEDMDKEFVTKVERALSRVERAVLADIEATGDRPVVNEGNQHLIVGGNVLYHNDPKDGLRMFPLSRYVVQRDPKGTVVEIVVEETVNINTLPPALVEQLTSITTESGTGGGSPKGDAKEVSIYTHLTRKPTQWEIYQECRGVELPGSRGSYKPDACPWFPVRMYSVAGENYGRSFVELQKGDLISLESLKQSLVEGSAVCAKVVGLANPNGVTSPRALAEASNGDIIEGNPNDVAFLQAQKSADFQVVAAQIQELERSLKTAFLMMDGVRRNAERVTAEEIRVIAQELETALGGVYTVISQEFQLPFIASRMDALTRSRRIPKLPKGVVQPSIVTGFEALGRGNDKQKLVEFLTVGAQLFGEQFMALINPLNAITRFAAASGISTEGLVKDEEELAKEKQAAEQQAQQAQMQGMVEKLGPEVMRQVGGMAGQMLPQGGAGGGAGGGPEGGPMPAEAAPPF